MPQRLPTFTISASGGELENRRRNQVVVQNNIGGLDQAQRLDREQVGIARSGSDKLTFARFGWRWICRSGASANWRDGHESRFADLPLRQLVQQRLALFAARMSGQNFAAKFAQIREPGTKILGQLLIDFAAQTLRDGGTFAGGRNGDLQIAAAHDRAEDRNRSWEDRRRCCRGCRVRRRPINGGIHVGESVAAMTRKLPSRSEESKGR